MMPVATMAEPVWHSVAGVRMEALLVLEMVFAVDIGSTAPSRRYGASIDLLVLMVFAFTVLVDFLVLADFLVLMGVLHLFSGEVFVESRTLDSLVLALFVVVGISIFTQMVGW